MYQLSARRKTQILFALTGLMLLSASSTDIYISSLPQMVKDFATTPLMVNLTLSSYNLGIAAGVLFVGEISNRYGRRSCILYGAACFAVASFLIGFIPSIHTIIVLRFVQSLGASIIVIVPRLILKDCMDEREQLRGNGILLMGFMISPAAAPVVGAYLAKYLGWQSCFYFSSLLASGLWVYCWKILPETNSTPIQQFAKVHEYLRSYGSILCNRVFLVLTAIYAGAVSAYYTFIGVSSYLYIDRWNFSPTAYSYLYIAVSLAYLGGNIVMQRMNRHRVSPQKIIAVGVYSTSIGAIILALSLLVSSSLVAIIMTTLSVLFMRAANAIISPTTQVRLMNHFHEKSGQALGLNMCISFIVISIAIYLVTLSTAFPLISLVEVSGAAVVFCAVMYLLNRASIRN